MSEKPKKPIFRIRAIAIAEVLLAIGILIIVNLLYFNGDRFEGVNPHPFWFVVILVSAQYGVAEGVFAVVVATFFYLIGNVRPRGEDEYIYAYLLDINSQPLLWLISALIIGLLRYRHILERDRLRHNLREAIEREEITAAQYEQLRMIREMLEQRLVRQVNTVVDTYHAARLMESLEPGKILEGVQDLVTTLLHPKKFSLYTLKDDRLELTLNSAWEPEDKFARTFQSRDRLFEEVIGKQRVLSVADGSDELILGHEGMIAGPIKAETGQILGMLKIEDIAYTDLNISTIQAFHLVGQWIGTAYYQAKDYEKVAGQSFINPDNNMYSYEFFKERSDYTTQLGKRFNFDVTVITAKIIGDDAGNKDLYKRGMKWLQNAVEKSLRKADTLCNYQVTDYTYYILLPGTPEANGQKVIEKIRTAFDDQQDQSDKLKLSLSTQSLYQKK
jgi:hypothetical protein